jgi:virulence factor
MRVMMIGLGQIAHKAYLPVLSTRADIELHFVTRDTAVLAELGKSYRVCKLFRTVDEALAAGPFDAAFVHTATSVHPEIVERLLSRGIAVFVDKPLAYSFESAQDLIAIAEQARRPLMVGFNRRYAPPYVSLAGLSHQTLLMWKHRRQEPSTLRETVFDDFIHVVDTLRFLSPREASKVAVETIVERGNLLAIVLTMSSATHVAVGMMNRDAGLDDERLEVIGGGGRRAVLNMAEVVDYDGAETRTRRDEWTSVSCQRGFDAMCSDFLESVLSNRPVAADDILETHRICELIVRHAEENSFR